MTIYQGHTQIHDICIYKQRFLYLPPDFFSVIPESTQCYVFQSQLYHSYKLFVILKMYEVRIINAAISYIKYRKNISIQFQYMHFQEKILHDLQSCIITTVRKNMSKSHSMPDDKYKNLIFFPYELLRNYKKFYAILNMKPSLDFF